jgi:hypothetical protein
MEQLMNSAARRDESTQWLVPPGDEPPFGAHVVTPRKGYVHHGIHVGGGRVLHYHAIWRGLRAGRVEEVGLERFARSRPVYVRTTSRSFDARTVVERAYSRLGERRYRLFTNNCEHFCEWCVRGRARSLQVDAWLQLPRRALQRFAAAAGTLAAVLSAVVVVKRWSARNA